jgi:hypothetical protein
MVQPAKEGPFICPECGGELWYDEEDEAWVCENCGIELYEEWEEEQDQDEEEEP